MEKEDIYISSYSSEIGIIIIIISSSSNTKLFCVYVAVVYMKLFDVAKYSHFHFNIWDICYGLYYFS